MEIASAARRLTEKAFLSSQHEVIFKKKQRARKRIIRCGSRWCLTLNSEATGIRRGSVRCLPPGD